MSILSNMGKTLSIFATGAALLLHPVAFTTSAYAQEAAGSKPQFEGLTRPPSEERPNVLLDADDAVLLLIDHQTGLFQTVKDVPVADLKNNTVSLAKIARQAGIPIIYTASEPSGPNGPIMSELTDAISDMQFVKRQGEVSAWDNAAFVEAVEATGRKTLIMAGVWTSVCVAFPALQANAEGYKVYTVMDASGDISKMASDAALARMTAAGVLPVTTNTILSETHRTWNRSDWKEWGALYSGLVPQYSNAVQNYQNAQDAAKQSENKD